MKKRPFNPKRKMAQPLPTDELEKLSLQVKYLGSPYHKRNPGDFGLTPPAGPRQNASLCDFTGIVKIATAQSLLKEGVKRGLISVRGQGDFPQNIWSVDDKGIPLEAQLDNRELGTYHGYPMPDADPLSKEVLRRWQQGFSE